MQVMEASGRECTRGGGGWLLPAEVDRGSPLTTPTFAGSRTLPFALALAHTDRVCAVRVETSFLMHLL